MQTPEILLIDDDVPFCRSVESFFAQNDIPLLTVSDPNIAKAINFQRFKVVLLDIDMPGVSGQDLIVDIAATPKPIIIMVSGHSDHQTRLDCLTIGADFFFSKPVDLKELSLVSERALGRTDMVQAEQVWVLLLSELAIRTPDNRKVGLSSSEFRVLQELITNSPNPVEKEILMRAAAGRGLGGSTSNKALEVLISRLRSRISSDAARLPIKALRNMGYIFHGQGIVENE